LTSLFIVPLNVFLVRGPFPFSFFSLTCAAPYPQRHWDIGIPCWRANVKRIRCIEILRLWLTHRMSLIPGDEYISSCLWPFRRRNSTAAKSFLSRPMPFSNSALYLSPISFIFQSCRGVLEIYSPCKGLEVRPRSLFAFISNSSQTQSHKHTASFFLLSRRHFR
jgi:hypothetical protein